MIMHAFATILLLSATPAELCDREHDKALQTAETTVAIGDAVKAHRDCLDRALDAAVAKKPKLAEAVERFTTAVVPLCRYASGAYVVDGHYAGGSSASWTGGACGASLRAGVLRILEGRGGKILPPREDARDCYARKKDRVSCMKELATASDDGEPETREAARAQRDSMKEVSAAIEALCAEAGAKQCRERL